MSSLCGKLEGDVEISADAAVFHALFGLKPHHTTKASPDKVLACDLHHGDWGNSDSVVNWNYALDGKAKTSKAKLVAIDHVNNSTTYSVFEGDLMEEFKSFSATVQATPKDGAKGSLVHWTLEYEKLNAQVAVPQSMLEFAINLTKDIDNHLCPDI